MIRKERGGIYIIKSLASVFTTLIMLILLIKDSIIKTALLIKKRNFQNILLFRNGIDKKIIIGFLILLSMINIVLAIPDTMTLQGKLTNDGGSPLQGTYNMSFKIYDDYTSGNVLWQLEDHDVSTDANGVYDVMFKDVNLNFSDEYYLGITVGTDDEGTPRINLSSSPYAFRANVSEDLNPENEYKVSVMNITEKLIVNNTLFVNGSMVGIGTSSPDAKLHISGGDFRSEGTFRTGVNGEPGRWRFYDSSGYLMSFWTTSTDYDTWGLDWDTSDNEMRWMGDGNIRSSIDLDDGSGYFQGNVGIGTTSPNEKLVVIGNVNISGTLNVSGRVAFPNLANCDTIDTDANGVLSCGSDDSTGGGSAWDLANNDTSATLTQLSSNITRGDLITPNNTTWAIKTVNDSIKDYYNHSIDLGGYYNTEAQLTALLDNDYVDVDESPTAADIAGSFSAGLTIGGNKVQLAELDVSDVSDDIAGDIAEGELADNIIVSADIKDGEVGAGDIGVDAVSDSELDGGFSWTLDADLNINSNTLVIDQSDSKVGIGTASPNEKLVVIGNVNISGTLNVSGRVAFPNLANCDTIDTDARGVLSCGSDDSTGGGSAWNLANYSAAYSDSGFDNENFTVRYDARADRFGVSNGTALAVGGEVSGTVASITLDNDALDDQYVRLGANFDNENFTTRYDARADRFGVGNYSSEYSDTGWKIGNLTARIPTCTGSQKLTSSDGVVFTCADDEGGSSSLANSTSWNRTGTKVVLANKADNVGIGTASPSQKLVVIGTANITAGLNVTGGMRVSELASCDTIDTDAAGNFKCGSDDSTGGGSAWGLANYSAAYADSGFKIANGTALSLGGDLGGTVGSATVDNTKCTGGQEYLDGTGNCDTLDGLGDFTDDVGFQIEGDAMKYGNITAKWSNLDLDSTNDVESGDSAGGDLTGTYPNPTIGTGKVQDDEMDYTDVTLSDFTNDVGFQIGGDVNSTSWNRTGTNVILAMQGDNVGIGTTEPSSTLEVSGNMTVAETNNTMGNFSIIQYNASCAGFRFGGSGGLILSCE